MIVRFLYASSNISAEANEPLQLSINTPVGWNGGGIYAFNTRVYSNGASSNSPAGVNQWSWGKNSAVTFYFEEKNSIYVAFINKYLEGTNKVSLASNNPHLNPDLYSKIKPLKKDKLDIYESSETELIAHLSEKQDIFVLLPKNSNLEMLRRTPEYGIIFDENTLDSIIENELNELMDVPQYVKDGGKLIYAVPTFDIKETMLIVHKFLEKNKDFKLIKENTYFPFEKDNSVFYYAVFEKKDNQ